MKLVVDSTKGPKTFVLRAGERAGELAALIVSECGLPAELKQALEMHVLQRYE